MKKERKIISCQSVQGLQGMAAKIKSKLNPTRKSKRRLKKVDKHTNQNLKMDWVKTVKRAKDREKEIITKKVHKEKEKNGKVSFLKDITMNIFLLHFENMIFGLYQL